MRCLDLNICYESDMCQSVYQIFEFKARFFFHLFALFYLCTNHILITLFCVLIISGFNFQIISDIRYLYLSINV